VDRKKLPEILAKDETPNQIIRSLCKVHKNNSM